jgi:hypothetical protein
MKTLFQRNQKAAFKSIESHIADCTTYAIPLTPLEFCWY